MSRGQDGGAYGWDMEYFEVRGGDDYRARYGFSWDRVPSPDDPPRRGPPVELTHKKYYHPNGSYVWVPRCR